MQSIRTFKENQGGITIRRITPTLYLSVGDEPKKAAEPSPLEELAGYDSPSARRSIRGSRR